MSGTELVVAGLVNLLAGGLLVELVRGLWQRRKMGADAALVVSRSAVILLEPLAKRVEAAEAEVASLRSELAEAARECAELRTALHDAQGEVEVLRDTIGTGPEE